LLETEMSDSLSPQMSHVAPARGVIASKQLAHTGSREIFVRGVPQKRQSEGKNAVKTPWAISAAPEAVERKKFLAL
jgi:hypothetical protein